ncbi:NAD-glutamate dehydrogenase [Chitiniphilus shinanonensis]|uniref:NAD-glutamate dehydrogenase n=1 Tax=Chitiniphilus shinanonensis TaxID=553088 RepID=A0ABQ6BQ55_9NEIS|nr:NAD-glutamate dehydrogenase [Chitiniphilus shinanonensis]GLS04150.1 NAD-glutamate dehydrogenase [Chitiniphilus shinanonensis]
MSYLIDRQDLANLVAAAPADAALRHFLAAYHPNLSTEDFASRPVEDWLGAAFAHHRFGARRAKGETLLRVYNPSLPEHGWESSHTVVELVVDDMPFLVDTVGMALARLGYSVHLVLHPVLRTARNADGQWQDLADDAPAESWMRFEIDRASDPAALAALHDEIAHALTALETAVTDWPAMTGQLGRTLAQLRESPPPLAEDELSESIAFLQWLLDGQFVFLGCREYRFEETEFGTQLMIVPDSGLGLLRDSGAGGPSRTFASLTPALRDIAYNNRELLILTKGDTRSIVHRPVYLDMVCVKRIDDSGTVIGEQRLLGLYTATAYTTPPRQLPILRRKIEQAMQLAGARSTGHRAKTLLNVLDTYPREELLEIGADELARIAQGVVSLHERSRVRTFFRDDIYRRYVSVMLYLPRDNYNTDVRMRVHRLLTERLGGSSAEFNVAMSDSPLARIHFIVRIPHGHYPAYDAARIEAEVAEIAQRWQDELRAQLRQHAGEEGGAVRFQRYQRAFPSAYAGDYPARVAVHDIDSLESVIGSTRIAARLIAASHADTRLWRLKLYRASAVELSDSLPLLENLGVRVLDERPYGLNFDDGSQAWIVDVGLRLPEPAMLEQPEARQRFVDAFVAIFDGRCENDAFNRLVPAAGLDWREALLLRAYARYLKQIGLIFDTDTLVDALLGHGEHAAALVRLFKLQLDPAHGDQDAAQALAAQLAAETDGLASVDEEKILSAYRHAILATVRSNWFQTNARGEPKGYLSFKLAPARIPRMPQPVPLFEIFVYSPEMEGVHLRSGKVARGGLRWSDRRDDFRTEVLGLVKAQIVKNTVIVPVGSKGGFVLKHPPTEREALLARGVACYRTFIGGLLDLTDNLVDGKVVPPPAVRRLDEDDPYLVVAADKGTATFSDIANSVSRDYGFWLDDAFASGGANGYDHKKMGITARGAWISATRHFREMGIDVATQPITVVGIGDMSGDVFGNGLLRSRAVKLVAAFDHRHVFIDPDPEPGRAFDERQRLFELPRSSWADYDAALISEGGGVWPRSARTIPLSPQARAVLGIEAEQLEPAQLIQALLKAPVDLLYNGGIGTYVKGAAQTQAEANDRGNDAVRVDGRDLRCKVVAEGGNLGFTQPGRIEYAQTGGRLFTDAIDNSAGVDCSDREVNIKILLNRIVAAGDLTDKQRNTLLGEMTGQVAELVLRDNTLQTLAIALEAEQAASLLPVHLRLMQTLERHGRLSRRLEYLPSDSQCQERIQAGQGLTRPELSVLFAYAKIVLKQLLLESDLVDAPRWNDLLRQGFPATLVERFGARLAEHPLRREIVATLLTNHVVNRYGITCVFRLIEETGSNAAGVVAGLREAEALLDTETLAARAERLIDQGVPAGDVYSLLLGARRQTERVARWLLQGSPDEAALDHLRTCAALSLAQVPEWLVQQGVALARRENWLGAGIPADLVGRALAIDYAMPFLALARGTADTGTLAERMKLYLALGTQLEFEWLAQAIEQLPRDSRWQALARIAARDDLLRLHVHLAQAAWQSDQGGIDARLAAWHDGAAQSVAQWRAIVAELRESTPDLAMISAALRELRARMTGEH